MSMRALVVLLLLGCSEQAADEVAQAHALDRERDSVPPTVELLGVGCTPIGRTRADALGWAREQARQTCLLRKSVADLAAAVQVLADRPIAMPEPKKPWPKNDD